MATLGTNSTAGTLSATSSADTATIACARGSTICIASKSDSANPALVNLSGVHGSSDFAHIDPGATRYFVARSSSPTLTFKTASGTATLYVDACVQ
jgi:hypothetical protein